MEFKNRYNKTTIMLTRGALVAALYVVVAYVSAPLQFAGFQFRLSEAFCILPIFMPEAVGGLFVGCLIANHITGCVIWDTLFGGVATLLGALGALLLGKILPERLMWLSTLPTVFANGVIVPLVIIYAYGAYESFIILALTVMGGELVTAGICGSLLYYRLRSITLFKNMRYKTNK